MTDDSLRYKVATIEKVRLTNIIYDNGEKRYNDTIFDFRSEHSVILLQNGIGKTVFIQNKRRVRR